MHQSVTTYAPAGMQPVLVHLSKNSKGQYSFSPVAVNFLVELAKTLFAVVTLLVFVSTNPIHTMTLAERRAEVCKSHLETHGGRVCVRTRRVRVGQASLCTAPYVASS